HVVAVSFSGAGGVDVLTAGSLSFSGVNQTAPYRNLATAYGDGTLSKLLVASAPGNMVINGLVAGCTINSSALGTGWKKNVNCFTGGGNGAASAVLGAPSVDLTYTMQNDNWAIIGADVNASPSGQCPTPPR